MKSRAPAVIVAVLTALSVPACAFGPAALGSAAESGRLAAVGHAGRAGRAGHQLHGSTRTPIKHFVFLMQGGRTFDSYFGTYPGADGIPAGTCEQLVQGRPKDGCVKPFLRRGSQPLSLGGSPTVITGQYDHGKMDGFVAAYEREGQNGRAAMGYYDAKRLPFYWAVARDYVLFDQFFSAALDGTRANRSYWVAAAPPPRASARQRTIFDRLQAAGISWKFYVQNYDLRQTYPTAAPDSPSTQTVRVPLLNYPRFVKDPELRSHIVDLSQYYSDLRSGALPAVAFIASSAASSERSASTLAAGQQLVRTLITQLMLSRFWSTSALMWSYDGSGGFYDHVTPPRAGSARFGFRVPALMVSAHARRGQVNHTILDYASALAFIERNWRLAPLTSRDATARSLDSAFNFAAKPRPPQLIAAVPRAGGGSPQVAKAPVDAIYWFYLSAAAMALMLVLLAVSLSARSARRLDRMTRLAAQSGRLGAGP